MGGGVAENPRHPDAEKLLGIAERESEGKIDAWIKRRGYDGLAWIAEEGDARVIEAPNPVTPTALYIFLHEVGHHASGHLENDRDWCGQDAESEYAATSGSSSEQEYEATMYALGVLERHGVVLPARAIRDLKWNIELYLKKEKKAGCPVNGEAEKFVYGENAMSNPWWGGGSGGRGAGVGVGDYVKAVFENAKGETERMWVQVTGVGAKSYTGTLNNQPVFRHGGGLKFGSRVTVKKGDVESTMKANPHSRSNPPKKMEFDSKEAALAYRRLVEAEGESTSIERRGWSKWVVTLTRGPKGNPEGTAAAMYESFHGSPSSQTVEVEEQEHYHEHLAELGVCCGVVVETVMGNVVAVGLSGYVWKGRGKDAGFVQAEGGDGDQSENPWWGKRTVDWPSTDKGEQSAKCKHGTRLKSAWTVGRAGEEAYKAGYRGNEHFEDWLTKHKLDDRSSGQKALLQKAWGDGVTAEHQKAVGGGKAKPKAAGTFHGYKIEKTGDGEFVALGWDAGSRFETLALAKQAIAARPNPKRGPIGGVIHQAESTLYGAAGAMDRELGRAIGNPSLEEQAFKDWLDNRAFWQQTGGYGSRSGYYKLKPVDSDGNFYSGKSVKAPWSDFVKKKYGNEYSSDFHRAAHAWEESGKPKQNPSDSITASTTLLCSNEDGTQLYLVGGEQEIDLESLGITGDMATKEKVVIGCVQQVWYETSKKWQDGKNDNGVQFYHHFSETSGNPLPELVYERLNEQLCLAGGSYKIDQPWGTTSVGIED